MHVLKENMIERERESVCVYVCERERENSGGHKNHLRQPRQYSFSPELRFHLMGGLLRRWYKGVGKGKGRL